MQVVAVTFDEAMYEKELEQDLASSKDFFNLALIYLSSSALFSSPTLRSTHANQFPLFQTYHVISHNIPMF